MDRSREEKSKEQRRINKQRRQQVKRRNMLILLGIVLIVGLIIGCFIGGAWKGLEVKRINEQLASVEQEKSDLVAGQKLAEEESETKKVEAQEWYMRLVTKEPVTEEETIDLTVVSGSYKVDSRIAEAVFEMMDAATEAGTGIKVRSAYRDWDTQELYFNNTVDIHVQGGKSYYDSYQIASQAVAVPGTSEHQLGLALDFTSYDYDQLDEGQADTAVAKWLKEHCCEYGFILRYPKGKEDITGVQYEPWHYRYVGIEAATEIMNQGITLEEYLQ